MRFFVFVVIGLALYTTTANTAALLPADHPSCKVPVKKEHTCDYGMDFYRAEDGRCGCLEDEDFHSLSTCERYEIRCNPDYQESLTDLFQYRDNFTKKEKVGCGCFSTFDGFPRE